jgi:hypothetical protein
MIRPEFRVSKSCEKSAEGRNEAIRKSAMATVIAKRVLVYDIYGLLRFMNKHIL